MRVFRTKSEAKLWLLTTNRKTLNSVIGRKPVSSITSALNRAIKKKKIKISSKAKSRYTKRQVEHARKRGLLSMKFK